MIPLGIKITFDYRSKKSKSCSILLARFEQKGDYRGKGGGAFVGMGSGALVAPLGSKTTVNYSPKSRNDSCYYWRILRRIYVKFIWRTRVSYPTVGRAFYGGWCSIKNRELFRTKYKDINKLWNLEQNHPHLPNSSSIIVISCLCDKRNCFFSF